MTIEIAKNNEFETLIKIDDEMTVYTVLEQKNSLLSCLLAGQTVSLDLSMVSEIDSAGIQLLIFLKKEAQRIESKLTFSHHSRAVFAVIELFNLIEFFADPIVIPAKWKE